MKMPRFLPPFRHSEHGLRSGYDIHTSHYDDDYQPRHNSRTSWDSRNASCWPGFFHKRGRNIRPYHINRNSEGIPYSPPMPIAMPSPQRSYIDDYHDNSYRGSDAYSSYTEQDSRGTHPANSFLRESLTQEPESYIDADPSPMEPVIHDGEPIPTPIDLSESDESFVPTRFQENFPPSDRSQTTYSSRSMQSRNRRGEQTDTSGVRIESEDYCDDYPNNRYRSGYSSQESGSHMNSSGSDSYSEPLAPVMISANPDADIEIGNEREGFIPYQQYLAQIEASRGSRGHRRRRPRSYRSGEEDQIYIIPPGANVIFVDEEGRELHRVGQIDERRYPRTRRNSRVRTTRQPDGSYLIEL